MTAPVLRSARLAADPAVPHGFVAVPDGAPPVWRPRQVHGARVVRAGRGARAAADGALSADPSLRVGVVTADCCPLLLASEDGRLVAAVHAGWRGLARGIVEAAVRAMARAGASPARLRGAVGPAAGGCCYEVGPEVLEALGLARGTGPGGRRRIDLRGLLLERLAAAGVAEGRVERVGPCTICSPDWPSYRRQGARAGRALAWIAPAAPAGANLSGGGSGRPRERR
ncbi:MAG: laccase domain-containing protein [Acidobacteria bacterium]|nr:MAG: laccase domain-containing protein [Acidobacteriota bacterium]